MLKELLTPPQVIVIWVTEALAVPEFVSVMYGAACPEVTQVTVPAGAPVAKPPAVSVAPVTETCAACDAEPKMPNTNPPIATAAIRVTAMINTVAIIGEIAFREGCSSIIELSLVASYVLAFMKSKSLLEPPSPT
jgi:hypothetical protein